MAAVAPEVARPPKIPGPCVVLIVTPHWQSLHCTFWGQKKNPKEKRISDIRSKQVIKVSLSLVDKLRQAIPLPKTARSNVAL